MTFMPFAVIDTNKNRLLALENDIFRILLLDKTTKRNIIWATDDYEALGKGYHSKSPITVELVTGKNAGVIQSRISKAKHNQTDRTKKKAEVFTPAWVCNEQNNLIDRSWFGRDHIFNASKNKKWKTNKTPIPFKDQKGARWQDYVDARRMEISCGEAPYLTSRYDMTSGKYIKIPDRVGLLDRKLRVLNENASSPDEWERWAFRALESIYGFELQGDSLLIARENILLSFVENMLYKFHREPDSRALKKAANIISWNLWQMDGLTNAVPFGSAAEQHQPAIADACGETGKKIIYCKIHDWRSKKTLLFQSLVESKG